MKCNFLLIAGLCFILTSSCKKESSGTLEPESNQESERKASAQAGMTPMIVFYDSVAIKVNMRELSEAASELIIAHNINLNAIYTLSDLEEGQKLAPVINAVPTNEFHPLWLQFIIEFNPGYPEHQFFSDAQVEAAVSNGEITLVNSGEVYRCSVIGKQ